MSYMKGKNKNIIIIGIFVIAFLLFYTLFSNWDSFKRGLMGKPPIESEQ